jgi:transcriptional regulator with XRE-family HTH domain
MDVPMPVSPERIKALRDAKAWSQAHLAEAAGLSLRTVQRVEAEGTASSETRLALAGALGVPVESLGAAPLPPAREEEPDQVPTSARVGVFAVSSAGLLFALWLGSGLPPQVASHFGAAGEPNGWMSRDGFVGSMVAALCLLPLALQVVLALGLKFGGVNIPNARYWLEPPRRAGTVRSLHLYGAWLGAGMSVFLGWVFWQVALANRASTAHLALDSHTLLIGMAAMLAAMTAWVAAIGRRFRRLA